MTRRKTPKRSTWASYRKIPNYEATMQKMEDEREAVFALIIFVLPEILDVEQEVGKIAGQLAIPFNEALYYKWNYCMKLDAAMQHMRSKLSR